MIFTSKKIKMNTTGQALVELALVLPFLLFLTFAIIEFGRYLYLKNTATNASREGARKAVVTYPWDPSVIITYTKTSPAMSDATVTITSTPSTPTAGTAVTVTVRKPFSSVVPKLLPQFKNLTSIRASATMRYE